MTHFPLGRRPRTRDPRFPHLSALLAGKSTQAPASVNWAARMPGQLGMLGNDQWGDCAEAGFEHARQVWSFNATGSMADITTTETLALYSAATGFVEADGPPGSNSTDQGTVLQALLAYLVKTGQLFATIEIDPLRSDHIDLATFEGGLVYLGMEVPAYAQDALDTLGSTLQLAPAGADASVVGGHCIITCGYQPGQRQFTSYGCPTYAMTDQYWAKWVDEAYVLLSTEWLERNGKTFAGYTMAQLDQQMEAVRRAA